MDVVSTDLSCRTVEDFSIPVTDGSHKCGAEYSLWPYTTRIPVDKTVATYMYCHIYVTGQNSIQVTIILSWFDSGRCKLQVAGYRKSQLPFFLRCRVSVKQQNKKAIQFLPHLSEILICNLQFTSSGLILNFLCLLTLIIHNQ